MIGSINKIELESPGYLWLLLLIIPIIIYYFIRQKKIRAHFIFPINNELLDSGKSWKVKFLFLPDLFRVLALIFIIFSLSGPRIKDENSEKFSEGIDLVISLDVSSSMLAEDLKPNRLEAAKNISLDFALKRKNDAIGLVVFSGESFTQCPLTLDHQILSAQLQAIQSGLLQDGTAIGLGLATAVDRLKSGNAKSKVLILLTDGVNNSGMIDPLTAAEIAKVNNVRVYTIGLGSLGMAPYPAQTPFGVSTIMVPVEIDEALLKKISQMTDGKYYRATDNNDLNQIYKEIDLLEKSKLEQKSIINYINLFVYFLGLALFFLLIEWVLRNYLLKQLP